MRHGLREAELPGWFEPAAVFASGEWPVWLDSGDARGTSYLGLGERVEVSDDPFQLLRIPRSGEGSGFGLGWVGWLGYELREATMGMTVQHPSALPKSLLLFVDRALAFDHETNRVRAMALTEEGLADVAGRVAHAEGARGSQPDLDTRASRATRSAQALPRATRPAQARWRYSDDEYLGMIRDCQAAIGDGEAYQLCLTNEARVGIRPDPVSTYLALRSASPSHHGSFFSAGEYALLSSSPELFLSVDPDGTVETRPIKGTRPRGATRESDAALATDLLASDKERAENLMIVDLMRNDLSRVCEVGTVSVPSLLAVESYPQVHQLVSSVRGTLAAALDPIDAVTACFPAGSMTGAPKRRAIELLDALERRPRGPYAGAFGYFGLDGRIDLAMVIRSIVVDATGATVGAGGGITTLSVPEEELAEAKLKAAALLAVMGALP
jgi:para-aminobenzoate synthetase component 1